MHAWTILSLLDAFEASTQRAIHNLIVEYCTITLIATACVYRFQKWYPYIV